MRFHLVGYEDPISDLAFPEGGYSGNRIPRVLQLEDGVPFVKEPWVAQGYTNYEVWCVGGSGGQGGGDGGSTPTFLHTSTRPNLSSSDWALYLEWLHFYNVGVTYTHWDPTPRPGAPNGMYVTITMEQYYEEQFPSHNPLIVTTYREPFLIADIGSVGGGGGGGGVQVVAGLLDELPDSCDVVVGQAGADSPPGQTAVNGAYTPGTPYPAPLWSPADTRKKELDNYFAQFQNKYPLPHPSFLPPGPGNDGGASSFGDTLCQASGGKGGNPAVKWVGSSLVDDGAGGDGGIGGSLTAGGGGLGSTSITGGAGADGPYNPVTGIGCGGGGGHGGTAVYEPAFPYYGSGGGNVVGVPASDGGRGTYIVGYAIYGEAQPKHPWYSESYSFDPVTGAITAIRQNKSKLLIVPGGGGGARALRQLNFGSRAEGYNPAGLVAIRLTQILN